MFTQTTVGSAKNISRQPYMPSAQVAGSTSVALVIPVFAGPLTTEGEKKLKMTDLHTMFHQLEGRYLGTQQISPFFHTLKTFERITANLGKN